MLDSSRERPRAKIGSLLLTHRLRTCRSVLGLSPHGRARPLSAAAVPTGFAAAARIDRAEARPVEVRPNPTTALRELHRRRARLDDSKPAARDNALDLGSSRGRLEGMESLTRRRSAGRRARHRPVHARAPPSPAPGCSTGPASTLVRATPGFPHPRLPTSASPATPWRRGLVVCFIATKDGCALRPAPTSTRTTGYPAEIGATPACPRRSCSQGGRRSRPPASAYAADRGGRALPLLARESRPGAWFLPRTAPAMARSARSRAADATPRSCRASRSATPAARGRAWPLVELLSTRRRAAAPRPRAPRRAAIRRRRLQLATDGTPTAASSALPVTVRCGAKA